MKAVKKAGLVAAAIWFLVLELLQIKQTTLNRGMTDVETNFFVTALSIDRAF